MVRRFQIVWSLALALAAASARADTISIADLGAVADSKTDCTAAFQKAIDRVAETGGTVRVPKGDYRIGPLFLKSHVTLRLEEGARLLGPGLLENYPKIKYPHDIKGALLSGVDLTDVAIVGGGVVDGNAPSRTKEELRKIGTYQPRLLLLSRCNNVRLEGVTFAHGPNFHVSVTGSNIVLDGVRFLAHTEMPWTGGLGLGGQRIRVANCQFENGDDNIAFGAVDDVLVEKCRFGDGHGLSVGSYIHGAVRNIVVRDCVFNKTKAGLRIKSARDRGNVCENISLENVTMTDVLAPVSISAYYGLKLRELDPNEKPQPITKTTPLYRNIRITNLHATGAEIAGLIAGLPEQPAANIVFRNTHITANEGFRVMNACDVQFIETTVAAKTGPPFLFSNTGTNSSAKTTEAMATAATPQAFSDTTRPVMHFRPPSQWMNDVCGAFYHNGWHHVFFQFNPHADTWGKGIGWGHARSRDLVHWECLPPALLPDRENGSVLDASGSAALDDKGRPVLFFAKSPRKGPREQWAALPEDDQLIRWRRVDIGLAPGKSGVPADINPSWADMFVFKAGGRTFATFKSSDGLICEAVAPNLLNWKAVGKVESIGGECPNLFPLQGRHVLIRSTGPISYIVGDFDSEHVAFKPSVDGARVLDCGPGPDLAKWNRGLYGTTVFTDAKGRTILLGWVSGFKSERGWNGCMSLPRILSLQGNDLIQTPIPELAELRGRKGNTCKGSCEVIAKFKPGEHYGLKIGSIPIVCDATKLNVASTEVQGVIAKKLHVFFDRSVIEVFINEGRRTVTKVVYPESDELAIEAFGDVESLEAWEVKSVW